MIFITSQKAIASLQVVGNGLFPYVGLLLECSFEPVEVHTDSVRW